MIHRPISIPENKGMDTYFSNMPYALEWVNMFNDTDFYGWIQVEVVTERYEYFYREKQQCGSLTYQHDSHRNSDRDHYTYIEVCIKGSNNEDIDEDMFINKIRESKRRYPSIRFKLTLPSMADQEAEDLYNDINRTVPSSAGYQT